MSAVGLTREVSEGEKARANHEHAADDTDDRVLHEPQPEIRMRHFNLLAIMNHNLKYPCAILTFLHNGAI